MSSRSAAAPSADPPSATMLARLRRYLVARRRGRPCRVLYVFGNPLGNALGDTIIASQSVPYLRHIAPRVQVSVWTGDERIWKLWRPGVDTRATLAIEDLDEVDFAVFENTHVPGVFKQRLRAGGAALLTWRPSDRHAVFVLDRGVDESVPLPVCSNVPSRSAEVYRALGWPDSAGANRRGRGARRAAQILLNPYSSVGAKSLTPQFLGLLLDAWRHAVPAGVELVVPARPGRAGGRDEQIYREIALRAESAVGGPIVVRTLPLRAYLNAIARAALVIGPDTSSQHIAADCRTPSVSCYAPDSAGGNLPDLGASASRQPAFHLPAGSRSGRAGTSGGARRGTGAAADGTPRVHARPRGRRSTPAVCEAVRGKRAAVDGRQRGRARRGPAPPGGAAGTCPGVMGLFAV